MIKLRQKRILKLQKQLSNAMTRVVDLETLDGESSESYRAALLKAKECSHLIQLHEKHITKENKEDSINV